MTNSELQLLPEHRKRIDVSIPGRNRPMLLSMILIVVVAIIYGALYFYKSSLTSSAQSVDNDLATLEQKRDKTIEAKLLLLNKKLTVASPLLAAHVYWSEGLVRIQNLTEPKVQFKNLSASLTTKKISFKAEGADYSTIAHQIAAFLNEKSITNITLDKVTSLTTGRVEFTMGLIFDQTTFLAKPK